LIQSRRKLSAFVLTSSPYIFVAASCGAAYGAAGGAAFIDDLYESSGDDRVSDYQLTDEPPDNEDREDREERGFSGRFSVRLPKYLHRQIAEIAREQGVSLNQFVCTAAAVAAGMASDKFDQAPPPGSNRVSDEEYERLWRRAFA
jgi:predicted HicB family RNase H-like nuclease